MNREKRDQGKRRFRTSVAGTLSWLVFGVLSLWWVGCVQSPQHNSPVASKYTSIGVLGATPEPNSLMRVEIYDFGRARWEPTPYKTILTSNNSTSSFYPVNWYTFFDTIQLIDGQYQPIDSYWLPQVLGNGDTSGTAARARLRVANDFNGIHRVLKPGYAACASGYDDPIAALDGCGDPGQQYFSDVLAAGFDDSTYERLPVVVRVHPAANIAPENADLALHAASVVMQREDPSQANPSGSGDYACPVFFERQGFLLGLNMSEPDADPDGIVSGDGELAWYRSHGRPDAITVIVVKQIVDCGDGGSGVTFGCGWPTSNVALVTEFIGLPPNDRTRLGPLWAHEMLHTFLGPWDHTGVGTELKSYRSLPDARRISEADCEAMLEGVSSL